ncbi:SDR family oxidoreductase [Allomuricauda sp. d1]|uniref:SDR family oxidoreductase n=1 Tax=Allomuricauda sp. d1 TaxID=3136725 RepID=UPI0031DEA46C
MQKPNNRLAGQTAIVTGGSSGIGAAITKSLALEGANVCINYHSDQKGANEVADWVADNIGANKTLIVQGDVGREEDVDQLFEQTLERFGTLDICVANAGIQKDFPMHEMSLEAWQAVINTNLTGQFLCARAAIRIFLEQGMRPEVSNSLGKIIHISSVHEEIPWAGHVNYATSKGGLVMLMESICQEYAPQKIRCNSIAPGAIKTDINKDVWSDEEGLEKILKLIPYGRMGNPEEIGSVVAWLASDESEYINGTTIFVDGGMTCYPGFSQNG